MKLEVLLTTSSSTCCSSSASHSCFPFLVALNLAGVMSGMAILKNWRVAVLVASFAALAAPAADIVSMLLLADILTVLYA